MAGTSSGAALIYFPPLTKQKKKRKKKNHLKRVQTINENRKLLYFIVIR